MKTYTVVIILLVIMLAGHVYPVCAQQPEVVRADRDAILSQHERSGREFNKLEIGDFLSYYHQRMIGEAIVEFDYIRYIFDRGTGELIEKTVRWRDGLPDVMDPVVTREEAESMVQGDVQFSKLYFISPESNVHPLQPVPANPCWVVRSVFEDGMIITIIDALTGELLGNGVPPPVAQGYSLTGPMFRNRCTQSWIEWAASAHKWFRRMGYEASMDLYPNTVIIQNHLRTDKLALFYELAHGDSYEFQNGCPLLYTHAYDIRNWLTSYANVPFAFIGSCGGLCEYTSGTFSYEFRKGRSFDTAVVGYCDMAEPECDDAWTNSISWQDTLFSGLAKGLTLRVAFDRSIATYPMCIDCMRYHGDRYLTLVPKITRSLCDTLYDATVNPLTFSSRDCYIRCDVIVPEGEELTIDPSVGLAFMFDTAVIADGSLIADGAEGPILFLSDQKRYRGIEITGRLRMANGGTIRIYND